MGQTCGNQGLEGTSEEINLQVESLEAKIAKADKQIKFYVAQGADPANKQRAIQLMKRKKVWEESRQHLIGAQFNVDSMADQEEQAKYTLKAVDAMKTGRERLKKSTDKMSAKQVDELLDDAEDLRDEMRAINDSLAQGTGLAELESEYAQLQREMMGAAPLAAQAQAPVAAPPAAQLERQQRQQQPPHQQQQQGHGIHDAHGQRGEGHYNPYEGRGIREECRVPPPPPPPPPRPGYDADKGRDPLEDAHANAWAAAALKAAMAPYGHLPEAFPQRASFPNPVPPQRDWNRRVPMAA
jgi:charged multivesicular body protein 5